jgi:AcrR family transcriptional regulator
MSLFLKQGFHGTTMRQIAVGAEVSLGAAYNHFAGKHEIFACLINEQNPYLQIALRLAFAPERPCASQLEDILKDIASTLRVNSNFIRLAMIDILEFQGGTLGQAAAQGLPLITRFFQQLVQCGVEHGEFRLVSPVLLMRAVAGMAISSVILETLNQPINDLLPVEDWENGYLDILLRGMLATDSEKTDTFPVGGRIRDVQPPLDDGGG